MADEIQKLILQVENENKIRDLVKLLDQQHLAMAKVIEQQKQGAISVQQYEAAMKASATTMVQYNKQVATLQASSGPSAGMQRMGMMQAGYALQDALSQRTLGGAMNAAANNIPGIAMGMGAGPQGVMAAMIGSAVVQGLAMILPQIMQAIKGVTAEDEKRALEKEKGDKEKAAEAQKLAAAPTGTEARFGAAVGGQMKALGGGAFASLRGAFMGKMNASPEDITAELRRQGIDQPKQSDILAARSVVENRMAEQEAKDLWDRASQGDKNAAAEIQRLAETNPELAPLAEAARGMSIAGSDVGPGRAEAAEQMMRDATRGGGPAYLPSKIFGAGGGGKTPAQQQREQAAQAAQAQRAAYKAQIAEQGGINQRRIGDVAGGPSGIVGGDEREAMLLQLERSSIEASGMADRMIGMNNSETSQRLQQIDSRLQILMQRMSQLNGGAGNGMQYSASPVANW